MANVATAQTAIPIGRLKVSSPAIGFAKVTPVICTFDTTASDLTVYTPAASTYAAIVGIVYSEASAHSLTIKSAGTTLVTLEQPANSNVIIPFLATSPQIFVVGALGEALKLNCGTAAISSALLYCVEFSSLAFLD